MTGYASACKVDGCDTLLRIRVRPAAGRNAVEGLLNVIPAGGGPPRSAVAIQVSRPAADGKANAGVRRLLAKVLAVPKGSVTIEHGHKSRDKLLRLSDLSPQAVEAALERATQ